MKPKLIFIGGAPGIGKSAVSESLLRRLHSSIWLDGDDVWRRMNPWRVDEVTTKMVECNIQCVLTNFLKAGFSYVILSWVLHRQWLIDRLVRGLEGFQFDFHSFTLICDEATLEARWESDPTRGPISELALERLAQTRALETVRIDTTGKSVEATVEDILAVLHG